MGSFSIKKGSIDKLSKTVMAYATVVDRNMESRMNAAVTIIYSTARAKRPMISVAQAKAQGSGYKTVFNSKGVAKRVIKRVSDPNATLGVPVDTGALQISIKKSVTQSHGKTVGIVSAGGNGVEYAKMVEYGTSKMQARPFMRPAINENSETVRNIFNKPIERL